MKATLKLAHDVHNIPLMENLLAGQAISKTSSWAGPLFVGPQGVPPSLAKKYKTAERRVSSSPALQLKS